MTRYKHRDDEAPMESLFVGGTDLGSPGEWESNEHLTEEGGSVFQAARARIEELQDMFVQMFPDRDLRELTSAKSRRAWWDSGVYETADEREYFLRHSYACFRDACDMELMEPRHPDAWAHLAEGSESYGILAHMMRLGQERIPPLSIGAMGGKARADRLHGKMKTKAIELAATHIESIPELQWPVEVAKAIREEVLKVGRLSGGEDSVTETIRGWIKKAPGLRFRQK